MTAEMCLDVQYALTAAYSVFSPPEVVLMMTTHIQSTIKESTNKDKEEQIVKNQFKISNVTVSPSEESGNGG